MQRFKPRRIPRRLFVKSTSSPYSARAAEINLGEWRKTFSRSRKCSRMHITGGEGSVRFQPGRELSSMFHQGMTTLYEILRNSKGNILAVAHAGLNRGIICHVLGIPLENLFRIEQDYGCLNELTFNNTGFCMSRINFSIGQTG